MTGSEDNVTATLMTGSEDLVFVIFNPVNLSGFKRT